jgi:hypothetical protein
MSYIQAIDWAATAAWVQALLTLVAIGAAVSVPYVAAWIDRGRRRAAAVRLAELTCQAVGYAAVKFGAKSEESVDSLNHMARTLSLPGLLSRMESMPSADIDKAGALEAFVRIAGAARTAIEISGGIREPKSLHPDQEIRIRTLLLVIQDTAFDELKRLKEQFE